MDVGRTLTRFNFPQAEVFNPLGVLLAHHLTQLDEAQRNATEATEDNDAGDDQPRPEVADAILATVTALGREPSGPESVNDIEREGEGADPSDGIVIRNFRPTDPIRFPDNIPIDSIRVDFTTGNMRFTTESTIRVNFRDDVDEGPSGAQEDRPSATNVLTENQTEVGTSIPLERPLEGTIVTSITRTERLTYFCIV